MAMSKSPGGFTTPALFNAPSSNMNVTGIAVNAAGRYVAVGIDASSNVPIFVTSPDGTNWTSPSYFNGSVATAFITGIAVNAAGRFVAVGYDNSNNPIYWTSTNGLSWSSPTIMLSFYAGLKAVAVNSSGLWVAVGFGTTFATYATSTDGLTWSVNTLTGTNNLFVSVAAAPNGTFSAVGYKNDVTSAPIFAKFASNGSVSNSPAAMNGSSVFAQMNGVTANSNGTFVAVGSDANTYPVYAKSTDGVTWNTPASMGGLTAIANMKAVTVYGNAPFIAVGDNGSGASMYATSNDGALWTKPANMNRSTASGLMKAVTTSRGTFIAAGSGGVYAVQR